MKEILTIDWSAFNKPEIQDIIPKFSENTVFDPPLTSQNTFELAYAIYESECLNFFWEKTQDDEKYFSVYQCIAWLIKTADSFKNEKISQFLSTVRTVTTCATQQKLLTHLLLGFGFPQDSLSSLTTLHEFYRTEQNDSISYLLLDLYIILLCKNNTSNQLSADELHEIITSDNGAYFYLHDNLKLNNPKDTLTIEKNLLAKAIFLGYELKKDEEDLPIMAHRVFMHPDVDYINNAILGFIGLKTVQDYDNPEYKKFISIEPGKTGQNDVIKFKSDIYIAGFTSIHLHNITKTPSDTLNPIRFIAPRNNYETNAERENIKDICLSRVAKDTTEVKQNFLDKFFENLFDSSKIENQDLHVKQHDALLNDFLNLQQNTAWLSKKHQLYIELLLFCRKYPLTCPLIGDLIYSLDAALPVNNKITEKTLQEKSSALLKNENKDFIEPLLEYLYKIISATWLIAKKGDKTLNDHLTYLETCSKILANNRNSHPIYQKIHTNVELLALCAQLQNINQFSVYQILNYIIENGLLTKKIESKKDIEDILSDSSISKYATDLSENNNLSPSEKQNLLIQLFSIFLLTEDNDRDTILSVQLELIHACLNAIDEKYKKQLWDKYDKFISLLTACNDLKGFPPCTTYRILKYFVATKNTNIDSKKLISFLIDKNRFDDYKKYFFEKISDKKDFIISLSEALCNPSAQDLKNQDIAILERLRLIGESCDSLNTNTSKPKMSPSNILPLLPDFLPKELKEKIKLLHLCNQAQGLPSLTAYNICIHLYNNGLFKSIPNTWEELKKSLLNPNLASNYIDKLQDAIKVSTIFVNEVMEKICEPNEIQAFDKILPLIAKCFNIKLETMHQNIPAWLSPETQKSIFFLKACEHYGLGEYQILRYLYEKTCLSYEDNVDDIAKKISSGELFNIYLTQITEPSEKLARQKSQPLNCIISHLKNDRISDTHLKAEIKLKLRTLLSRSQSVRNSVSPDTYSIFEDYLKSEEEKEKRLSINLPSGLDISMTGEETEQPKNCLKETVKDTILGTGEILTVTCSPILFWPVTVPLNGLAYVLFCCYPWLSEGQKNRISSILSYIPCVYMYQDVPPPTFFSAPPSGLNTAPNEYTPIKPKK